MGLFWLYALAVLGSSHGARILGIFPMASYSHQLPFRAVMKALASRGHHVTVITTDPLKVPPPNYTNIDLSFSYDLWTDAKDSLQEAADNPTPYRDMLLYKDENTRVCEAQLSSQPIQTFLKSSQQFDLVFIEAILSSCFFGMVAKVGSPPVIGILSFFGLSLSYQSVGSPFNPAVVPDILLPYDDHMSVWERVDSTLYWLWTNVYIINAIRRDMDKLSKQYFGAETPNVWEIEKNISLFMVNNHWSLGYPRAVVPAVIPLGSLHLDSDPEPLPKDLQVFLDGATEGFVYFSLGSNARSDKLAEEKRNALLSAFAALPQKVLWKWESDSLPGQPDNVMVSKWLPQLSVLAHPNCRLFMTQGGLQSFQEATHHAVPLVGVPILGDQAHNVRKMVNAGVGLKLDLGPAASKESILDTLTEVINNPSYRENMRRLSAITRDEPEPPLARAVWWTEFVLRHKGARHLRSASLDLSWPQYLLLDVIGFLLASLFLIVLVLWVAFRKLLRVLRNIVSPKLKQQ